jgi:hypothetical protein
MAYDDQTRFMEDFKKIHPTKDNNGVYAWNVYKKARENSYHFCLMGRMEDRKVIIGDKKLLLDKFIFLGDEKSANFQITDGNQPGNVLQIDGWSLGINDAWVLGGIHGNKGISSTFNFFKNGEFSTEKEKIDKFADEVLRSEKYGTTVTAREILGLISQGYQAYVKAGALLFEPTTTAKLDLTFQAYNNAVKAYTGEKLIELIKGYLNSAKKG